eukprot:jgi/Orpsp1_1/1179976/evm.model.c7180000071665.1
MKTLFDFIKYIIPLYQSLNYYISVDKYRYTSPLFAAIDAKSISIISLLLKHGENINFKIGGEANIDIEMFYQNCLQSHMTNEIQERKILKYLLNYGFSPSLDFVDIILKDTKYNSLLKLLFEYKFFSIYNTSFILNFLLLYKGQEPLSHSKLKSILLDRNSKFIVKKKWFQGESLFKNDIALQILCRYTQSNFDLSMDIILSLYNSKSYESLKKLTPAYFNINLRTKKGKNLFDFASKDLNEDMMVYLIKNGAEIDYDHLYINETFVNRLIEINYPNSNIIKIIDNAQYPNIVSFFMEEGIKIEMGIMLLQAIYYDNDELSKYLVDKGANMDFKYYYNFQIGYLAKHYVHNPSPFYFLFHCENITPLILSILKGNEYMVKYLIDKGANVNHYGKIVNDCFVFPINCAIKIKKKNIINYLIEHKVNINEYITPMKGMEIPLEYAISENNNNVDMEIPLEYAITIYQNNIKLVKVLIHYGADVNLTSESYSPFNIAIFQHAEDIAYYLVKKGANLNECHHQRQTPLMCAIQYKWYKLTHYLIELGVDINENIIGITPLVYAIINNNVEFVKYFIKEHHVDVNELGNNLPPLIHAIEINDKPIVECLVEAGADINRVYDNQCPLSYAIDRNVKCIVQYLMEQGVAMDEWPHKKPAIVYALHRKRMDIAKCLVDYGLTLCSSE